MEKQLPSCDLSKRVLSELQEWLTSRGAELTGPWTRPPEFRIILEDGDGTETLSDINLYPPDSLPDRTKMVTVKYDRWSDIETGSQLELALRFSPHQSRSKLAITVTNKRGSREVAAGLVAGVLTILSTRQNRNSRWHIRWRFLIPLYLLGALADAGFFLGWVKSAAKGPPPWILALGAFASIMFGIPGIVLVVAGLFKPYTAFDSAQTRARNERWKWVVRGFWAFVLFGTVLAAIRKLLLGF
ncbi:MAG TPA: hypothetical protein VN999_18040 [Thermoanaerobaculia bacterium]|nr:hypothetical protein [Thermoanaerobaculia bacterium]